MKQFFQNFEENLIAFFLGVMTLVTFIQVVARYVFQSGIFWALELTVFCFAWLVLLGMSYGVKKTSHLGVDALLNILPPAVQRICGFITLAGCIIYCLLLLYGSLEYWYLMYETTLEVDDVPFPAFLQVLFGLEPDTYETLPKYIPYFALPLGFVLLIIRFVQAGLQLWRGERKNFIASHEVEETLEALVTEKAASTTDKRG